MNNLNKVRGEGYKDYNQTPQEEGLIDKRLPLEIFEMVLSYLDDMDIQQSSLVSRFWSAAAIDTAKHEEFSKINLFANFLGTNLQEESYKSQRDQLFGIGSNRKIFDSVNLIRVKSSIHGYKKTLLNVLKDLRKDDLKNLEELSKNESKPKFFENIFDLAIIYKIMDEVGQITDDVTRGYSLKDISKALAQSGSIDKAIEVANTIPCDGGRAGALKDISKALAQSGSIDKAIEVANTIPPDVIRVLALEDISKALAQSGSIDKAIEVANTIPCDVRRGCALADISKALAQSGSIDKAIEVANTIPYDGIRGRALQNIEKAKMQ